MTQVNTINTFSIPNPAVASLLVSACMTDDFDFQVQADLELNSPQQRKYLAEHVDDMCDCV